MRQTSWGRIGRRPPSLHIAIILFAVSYFIYGVSAQGSPVFFDLPHGGEIVRVALTLAHLGTFADPYYALPTGSTAHTAPAYGSLFAFVAKVFGEGFAGATFLKARH